MKNRAVCRVLVCALTLTMVAPPTIAQQYIDPLSQRFDQAAASVVVQPVPPRPNVAMDLVKDTVPQTGARKAAISTTARFESEEAAQNKVSGKFSGLSTPGVVSLTGIALAFGIFVIIKGSNRNDDEANLLAATSGTSGTTGTR